MATAYNGVEYYKKMLDLQDKLRKSEEERIRLEERFNLLSQESRARRDECMNRLRMRYIDFLEEQRVRDERNHNLLGALSKIDGSLSQMSAKTERLNVLRKQYEAHLLNTYGSRRRPESTAGDSGIASQNEERASKMLPVNAQSKFQSSSSLHSNDCCHQKLICQVHCQDRAPRQQIHTAWSPPRKCNCCHEVTLNRVSDPTQTPSIGINQQIQVDHSRNAIGTAMPLEYLGQRSSNFLKQSRDYSELPRTDSQDDSKHLSNDNPRNASTSYNHFNLTSLADLPKATKFDYRPWSFTNMSNGTALRHSDSVLPGYTSRYASSKPPIHAKSNLEDLTSRYSKTILSRNVEDQLYSPDASISQRDDERTRISEKLDDDLEKYISRIRRLQEPLSVEEVEPEHDQNTSGDILNVSLSEDGVEEVLVEDRGKEEKLPDQVKSVLELATDLVSASRTDLNERDDEVKPNGSLDRQTGASRILNWRANDGISRELPASGTDLETPNIKQISKANWNDDEPSLGQNVDRQEPNFEIRMANEQPDRVYDVVEELQPWDLKLLERHVREIHIDKPAFVNKTETKNDSSIDVVDELPVEVENEESYSNIKSEQIFKDSDEIVDEKKSFDEPEKENSPKDLRTQFAEEHETTQQYIEQTESQDSNAHFNSDIQYESNSQYNENIPPEDLKTQFAEEHETTQQYVEQTEPQDPNARYDENIPFDPNAQYDSNVPYSSNIQYDQSAPSDGYKEYATEEYTQEQYEQYYGTESNNQYQDTTDQQYAYDYNQQYQQDPHNYQDGSDQQNPDYNAQADMYAQNQQEYNQTYGQYEQYDQQQYQQDCEQYEQYEGNAQYEVNQEFQSEEVKNLESDPQAVEYSENRSTEEAVPDEKTQSDKVTAVKDPPKKRDVIKSLLDSDTESTIERNVSNTESDFDFN